VVLPLIGVLVALAAACHRRFWHPHRTLRRWVFGPMLSMATILACGSLLYLALGERAALSLAHRAEAPARAASKETGGSIPVVAEANSEPVTEPATPEARPERAPNEALVAAVAEGPDGLRVLSERHPRDPTVLKALVLAFATKKDTLIEAVETTRRLLSIAPESADDRDLHYIVSRAADDKGKASELAFVVMSQHMGRAGADLLYDLMLRRPELETRVKIALESLRRTSQFSPALAIAYDLRFAPSCASRLGLLPRAREFGDDRSAQLLGNLSRRPPGCKKTARRPCRARCGAESRAFMDTVRKIYAREAATKNARASSGR
jgi:hypothetical protein